MAGFVHKLVLILENTRKLSKGVVYSQDELDVHMLLLMNIATANPSVHLFEVGPSKCARNGDSYSCQSWLS